MPRSGKCKTDLINFDVPVGPPFPTLPGFGLNLNIPGLDIPFPEGFPENLFDLLNKLKLKWPGGIDLNGLLDNFMRKLSQLISNILTQLATFLALYNLLLALIQIIVCIIEVLCALLNPRKVKKKVKRLFRTCMPIFLSIFPFLALLALILAILALLLALIEYIIALLKKIIEELIRNFKRLFDFQRETHKAGIIAVTRKIASILCVLENLVILFLLIKTIIDVIKIIKNKTISPPCKDTDGCGCDVCPECANILLHPENVITDNALVTYDAVADFITSQVTETVTLTADSLPEEYKFYNILGSRFGTNRCPVGPFFPPSALPVNYDPLRSPYLLNLKYFVTDGYGDRDVTINDIIVNSVDTLNANGRFTISGGTANDPGNIKTGWTITEILRGRKAPPIVMNVEYSSSIEIAKFTPNYDALMALGLTTVDCDPDIIDEKNALYSTINENQLDDFEFPDLDTALSDIDSAIGALRTKVNLDTIDTFNNNMNAILDKLKSDTEDSFANILDFMVDPLHSTAELDPELQFITSSITVKAILRNSSSQNFSDVIGNFPIPSSAADKIKAKLTGNVTLGTLSSFEHDGYGNFIADITSAEAGDGYLTLFYSGQQFGEIIRPDDLTLPTQVIPLEFMYTFVGVGNEQLGVREGMPRRDETDTSNT